MPFKLSKNHMFNNGFVQREVKELKSIFQENGYPSSFFVKTFKRFLNEIDTKEKDHRGNL